MKNTEQNNSVRTLLQATYTPISREAEDVPTDLDQTGRAIDKWSFLNWLAPTTLEIDQLRERIEHQTHLHDPLHLEQARHALEVLQRSQELGAAEFDTELVSSLHPLDPNALIGLGHHLIDLRRENVEQLLQIIPELAAALEQSDAPTEGESPMEVFGDDLVLVPGGQIEQLDGYQLYRLHQADTYLDTSDPDQPTPETVYTILPDSSATISNGLSPDQPESVTVKQLIDQHLALGILPEQAKQASWLLEQLQLDPQEVTFIDTQGLRSQLSNFVTYSSDLVQQFTSRIHAEPLGYIHLEKLNFTSMGTARGPLVHSVPLTPGEEVSVAHREWSNDSREFEQIVSDYLEEFSEEEVAEKTELAQSVQSQKRHSNGFNTGVNASGGFGPIRVTTSVAFKSSNASSMSLKQSRKQSRELTGKASSRVKKDYKVSFKTGATSGVEDKTERKIRNTTGKAARADYYQMMRKWRVDLIRYDVRLTYDLAIPEPGAELLVKIREMQQLDQMLEMPFEVFFASLGKAYGLSAQSLAKVFDKSYGHQYLDRLKKAVLALQAEVTWPPSANVWMERTAERSWHTRETAELPEYIKFEFTMDDRYEPEHRMSTSMIHENKTLHPGIQGTNYGDWKKESIYWSPESNKVTIYMHKVGLASAYIRFRAYFKLKETFKDQWVIKTWKALRDAAQAMYEQNQQVWSARRERLEEELSEQDALSLRKMEREEIMKNMLRWIIGPKFDFGRYALSVNTTDLYHPTSGRITPHLGLFGHTLLAGEMIKFLHKAIEWENMVYMLYPYFWTHPSHWQNKLHLDHPDPLHKSFLKAGSARVVLPIRPGFEAAFMTFVNFGDLQKVSQQIPYLDIAQEMKNFAQTNYPGIPAPTQVVTFRPLVTWRQEQAWRDMEQIIAALENYRKAKKRYPKTAEGIVVLQDYLPAGSKLKLAKLKDPWKKDYHYESPGQYGEYDLASWGKNGTPGITPPADPDAEPDIEEYDLTSWAVGNLIDQWYEFTPVNALDLDFNSLT